MTRETKKPLKALQEGRDETFLLQHSSRSSSAAVTTDQIREELARLLETSEAGTKAVDQQARALALGRVSGLEEAIRLIDKAVQEQASARIKAAATGKGMQ